jgi:hypothetical protein
MLAIFTKKYGPLRQVIWMTISFILISTVVVFYALGFKINWQAKQITQTASLYFSSDISGLKAKITLNGKLVGTTFPTKLSLLFPGNYDLKISKNNYQTYEKLFQLKANQILYFSNILLILQKTVQGPSDLLDQFIPPANQDGVLIKNGDEIWLNGQFITRVSGTINYAAWYPDNKHILYEVDNDLWLSDLEGQSTMHLVTLETPISSLSYANNGQYLVYSQQGNLVRLQLY